MRTPSSSAGSLGVQKIARAGFKSLAPALGAALLATGAGLGLGGGAAEAKTPGKTYCFNGKCHRVKTLAETEALVGAEETVRASHYDSCKRDRHNPCGLTSSGEAFNSEAPDNAASPVYPDGTVLLVWSPATRASIVVRVNNAGPFWGDRTLDVSRGAAEILGFAGRGVATLKVRVIDAPSREEATYKRNRKYDPVPGYIGTYASLDEAEAGTARAYQVAGLASPFPEPAPQAAGAAVQLAGAIGTQSGAALVPPTVLAAADARPLELAQTRGAQAPARPVAPLSVVAMMETDEAGLGATPVALRDDAAPARKRSLAERSARQNSRSYRVATARQKPKRETAPVVAAATVVQRLPERARPLTQDGTNDMSVFSRHVYAGQERFATQERARRRPAYTSAGRYAAYDDGNG